MFAGERADEQEQAEHVGLVGGNLIGNVPIPTIVTVSFAVADELNV